MGFGEPSQFGDVDSAPRVSAADERLGGRDHPSKRLGPKLHIRIDEQQMRVLRLREKNRSHDVSRYRDVADVVGEQAGLNAEAVQYLESVDHAAEALRLDRPAVVWNRDEHAGWLHAVTIVRVCHASMRACVCPLAEGLFSGAYSRIRCGEPQWLLLMFR